MTIKTLFCKFVGKLCSTACDLAPHQMPLRLFPPRKKKRLLNIRGPSKNDFIPRQEYTNFVCYPSDIILAWRQKFSPKP